MMITSIIILIFLVVLLFDETLSFSPLALGYDFGTSGVRICVIDKTEQIIHEDNILWKEYSCPQPEADATVWVDAQLKLLKNIPIDIRSNIYRICSSGTSASCLIYDISTNQVTRTPRMYNYNVVKEDGDIGIKVMKLLNEVCPEGNAANAPTSTLAKVLSWKFSQPFTKSERLVHQADYLAYTFHQQTNFISEWHNSLKIGYDVINLKYPQWLLNELELEFLPNEVIEPGTISNSVNDNMIEIYSLPLDCKVISGTTDSIAAFIASGASEIGQAVSSLGSTLAIKLLSSKYVDDSSRGIYSHRLDQKNWLVGGASNVGCAILRKLEFSNDELKELSNEIDPNIDIQGLENYYPLCNVGERFPTNDPNKQPILDPIPDKRSKYLWGILQSISYIEKEGYNALESLGSDQVKEIFTAGGGSQNHKWTLMRERIIGVPVKKANNIDAAFGAAKLASKSL